MVPAQGLRSYASYTSRTASQRTSRHSSESTIYFGQVGNNRAISCFSLTAVLGDLLFYLPRCLRNQVYAGLHLGSYYGKDGRNLVFATLCPILAFDFGKPVFAFTVVSLILSLLYSIAFIATGNQTRRLASSLEKQPPGQEEPSVCAIEF